MDELFNLINQYIIAQSEADACKESCAEDTGYFCYRQIKRVERVESELKSALNTYIDDRVAQVLAELAATPAHSHTDDIGGA